MWKHCKVFEDLGRSKITLLLKNWCQQWSNQPNRTPSIATAANGMQHFPYQFWVCLGVQKPQPHGCFIKINYKVTPTALHFTNHSFIVNSLVHLWHQDIRIRSSLEEKFTNFCCMCKLCPETPALLYGRTTLSFNIIPCISIKESYSIEFYVFCHWLC